MFSIIFSTLFINNIILNKIIGTCPFIGVSTKRKNALSMGLAVIFVIVCSSVLSWVLYEYVLVPYELTYLTTIIFILVIASFVQLVEMVIKRFSPGLYSTLGIYLPLITTNCAVLQVANDVTLNTQTLGLNGIGDTIVYAFGVSLGFTLAIFLFSAIREQLNGAPIKRHYKGVPIAFMTAFAMALAFMGFGGMA